MKRWKAIVYDSKLKADMESISVTNGVMARMCGVRGAQNIID